MHVFAKLYFAMANNEKDNVGLMQLPEDFWTFSFELTNSHLFQRNLIPALHDNNVTVT